MANVLMKFWRTDKENAKKFAKENNCIVALEYLAFADADSYVMFKSMEDYEQYKAETYTSIYSGWITLDFAW